jgi:hypothetical protein
MVSIDHLQDYWSRWAVRPWRSVDVLINSGELYRSFGGYPGSTHGMPSRCDAMQVEMKPERRCFLAEPAERG